MTQEKIHRTILENLSDGVITISRDGAIVTFNNAAKEILGLKAENVINRPFGEVFYGSEGNDQFNQAVLNAVYDSTMLHYNLISYRRGDEILTLAMTTSLISLDDKDGKKIAAVIVVFDDVTEIEKLRESEKTLTETVKAKHQELVNAYMDLESTNKNLQGALKKVQIIRIIAASFIFLLFITIGYVTWKKPVASGSPSGRQAVDKSGQSSVKTYVADKQILIDKITLKGALKPLKIINIISPFSGTVKEVLYRYGQSVSKDQLLLRMDTADLEVKYREAKVAYIEALENMKKYENWEQGDEVTKAKRSLTKSLMTLESNKNKYENSDILFKKGIISKTELEGDKQSYESAKMDYEAATEEYKNTQGKGKGNQFEAIRLKLANARHKLNETEQQLKQSSIYAPVSGTVILSDAGPGQDKKGKTAERGISFSQGEVLVSIGDTEGLSVSAVVDEMEVIKIKKGQDATITVDAYPDIILKGTVSYVSTQASQGEAGRKSSSFEVVAAAEKIPEGVQEKLRLGMSAVIDIIVLNKPDTIMIPIGAVSAEGANRTVTVQDKNTKELKKVTIETGITTLDMVEIIKGLASGDVIVVP